MIECLTSMLNELQDYKKSKVELMPMYIEARLSKSFEQYSHELQQSILVLTRKHEKSILKRLEKLDVKHCK